MRWRSNKKDKRSPPQLLAAYGTLRPGEANHGVVSSLPGRWISGRVRGHLERRGRYPILITAGRKLVPVKLFCSPFLPRHWTRIDRFEGIGYKRVLLPVRLETGRWVSAFCYVSRSQAADSSR
jgi:gamma-glutamylcyclotransferase (GGCT)/AIG2-like uncharacterized protein YtfP